MLEMMAAVQRPHTFTILMLQEKHQSKTTEDFELQIFSTQKVYHIVQRADTSSSMTRTYMQLGSKTPVGLHKQASAKTLRAPYPTRMVPTGQGDYSRCQGMDMPLLWDNIHPSHLYRVWRGRRQAHNRLVSQCG